MVVSSVLLCETTACIKLLEGHLYVYKIIYLHINIDMCMCIINTYIWYIYNLCINADMYNFTFKYSKVQTEIHYKIMHSA